MLSHAAQDELIDQGLDTHVAMFVATVDLKENVLYHANAALLPPAPMVAHDMSDTVIRKRVIEAHRVLMCMNEQNERTFKDLVEALELEQEESAKAS